MRLTRTQLTAYRYQTWDEQGRCCGLTGRPLAFEDAVVDHCHTTGVIRGVIDRGANSMLGKIENHRRIARMTSDKDLSLFLNNVVSYLRKGETQAMRPDAVLYPTHRTADEKRTLRNKRERKRRADAKGP
jgi:Recombination endonuclease VII